MQFFNSLFTMLCQMAPYILLGFFIAGIMHAFIPRRTMAKHLSGRGWKSVMKGALIGVPLPLCSCGVLPTAIAMHRSGASKASSTSFLIATPQTGVDSIAATWSLLGAPFAIIRPIAALVTSFFGGIAVGKTEEPVESAALSCEMVEDEARGSFATKLAAALRYGFIDLVGSIGLWLVAGLLIAAAITVWVPDGFFSYFGDYPLVSMLLVLLVAVPMYVCATGSIPIAMSLMLKGLSPGTALVLLMAGPAANFASFTLISREMGKKSAWCYLLSIVAGSILFGLMIDYLMPTSWFAVGHGSVCHHAAGNLGWFSIACAAVLALLLIFTLVKNRFFNHKISTDMTTKTYKISGMNCPHCQAAVKKAIESVPEITEVAVDLNSGIATVAGEPDDSLIISAVAAAGFEASPA